MRPGRHDELTGINKQFLFSAEALTYIELAHLFGSERLLVVILFALVSLNIADMVWGGLVELLNAVEESLAAGKLSPGLLACSRPGP